MSSFPTPKLIFEISAPKKIDPHFYNKLSRLLQFSNKISLTSHPKESLSGIDRNIQLIEKLRTCFRVELDIIVHVTCFDVNELNLVDKLQQLLNLQVKQVLVISGDNYTREQHMWPNFKSSSSLLRAMQQQKLTETFERLYVAAYPAEMSSSAFDELSLKLSSGANGIVTQCVYDTDSVLNFSKQIEDSSQGSTDTRIVEIIPSTALFKDYKSLKRFESLTQAQPAQELSDKLLQLSGDQTLISNHTKHYSQKLICDLLKSYNGLHLCTLNQLDFTFELLTDIQTTRKFNQ